MEQNKKNLKQLKCYTNITDISATIKFGVKLHLFLLCTLLKESLLMLIACSYSVIKEYFSRSVDISKEL